MDSHMFESPMLGALLKSEIAVDTLVLSIAARKDSRCRHDQSLPGGYGVYLAFGWSSSWFLNFCP